ncbi:MAG TPA: transporter substrate-binding domain-containing protein [Pseudonocardiaceae bacterium]|nr:transporter substrate-binding domain-containing protein [Pseudonocardiaceae bacterium]
MEIDTAIVTDLAPTGALRASINLGNPILAQGTPEAPTGVTVDIARELGSRLGVPVELVAFHAAKSAFEAMPGGLADVCFLAIEPVRAAVVAFTAPYVLIEGVFAVPKRSGLTTVADVDQPGVRIGVAGGSAYDLYLSRTFQHAELVRGEDAIVEFRTHGLEAVAGIRQPLGAYVATQSDLRLIDERFMQIRQAVGTTKARQPATVRYLQELVEELKATGFIADALRRAGQLDAEVAPPA